jgi:hypothetical protein
MLNRMITILCLLPLHLLAQSITGVWTGHIYSMETKLPYELVISEQDGRLNGYALTVFMVDGVENMGIKSIKLHQKKDGFLIEDEELVFDTYTTPPKRIKLLGNLTLATRDTVMVLTGTFTTRSLDRRVQGSINPYSGTIQLKKQDNNQITRLTAKLDELNLLQSLSFLQTGVAKIAEKKPVDQLKASPQKTVVKKETKPEPPVAVSAKQKKEEEKKSKVPSPVKLTVVMPKVAAADLQKRKTEFILNIFFSAYSVLFSLYDIGTVDGDTVSVVLNGKVILARIGLKTTATRIAIPVTHDLGDSLVLVMFAENLGNIPPNTGLLIIQDGTERNEIRFAGDMQKSSAVVLRRKSAGEIKSQ